ACRPRSRRVPQEVHEQADQGEDEDDDDPERLPTCSEVGPPDDTYGDEDPDEDPGGERESCEHHRRRQQIGTLGTTPELTRPLWRDRGTPCDSPPQDGAVDDERGTKCERPARAVAAAQGARRPVHGGSERIGGGGWR